jgi:endoglucanase
VRPEVGLSRTSQNSRVTNSKENQASAIRIAREGVATGPIGIPNRYTHSPVEVVHLDDLTGAAQLLAEFCAAVGPGANWIP